MNKGQKNPLTPDAKAAHRVDLPRGIHQIRTPLGFPGVPTVNCYVVENPLTLIDAGLNSPASWKAFVDAIETIGYRPEQFERILITHAHPDHFGFAERVRKLSNAKVFIGEHSADSFALSDSDAVAQRKPVYREFFLRLGLDDQIFSTLALSGEIMRSMAPRIQGDVTLVRDGDRIPFRDFELEVLYTPGHTREIVCYYEPKQGLIFSSDHLLQETSPNPIIDLGPEGERDYRLKFRSLVSYFDQIERVRRLKLSCVLPGHGNPFAGHEAVIDSLLHFYNGRQGKILNTLEDAGPTNLRRLAERVFPKAAGMQFFLATCELLGNLEVMEDRGSIQRHDDGRHYIFQACPAR